MQWILQEFEDTRSLADALDRMGIAYSLHKVIPFVGDLVPEPVVADPRAVVMFGSYSSWRYAEAKAYSPGVFRLRPFVDEAVWKPFLLNGPGAIFLTVAEIPTGLVDDGVFWFVRPVDDSKELPGSVRSASEILEIVRKVLTLDEHELPRGSLRHDTQLMLCRPVRILKEWRTWVVRGKIITYSLYKEGSRVVYRHEMDSDAMAFAQRMADLNPEYSPAYVLDVCRTEVGLKLLETNCLNAAGFYAADLFRLVEAIEGLEPVRVEGDG